jgi:hypothetical protein
MASFDLPESPQRSLSPALLVGAASPLWTYFAAAAAGGVAYWWMTQWARPVNLEAMFGRTPTLPALSLVAEPVVEAAEAVTDTVIEAGDAAFEAAPVAVGGEAAPVSPMLETTPPREPEPVVAPEPETAFAVAPEPVIEEPGAVAAEPSGEPMGKSRTKKAFPPLPETDA